MAELRGGVQTNSVSVGSNTNDNIYYSIQFQSQTGNDTAFGVFAGNTKVAWRTVAGWESGTWQTRTLWPTYNSYLERTQYSLSGSWVTSWTGSQRAVYTALKMVGVKMWNTSIQLSSTSVQLSDIDFIFDNFDTSYSYLTTRSDDAIYGQCATNNRLQFRLTTSVGSLNLSNCPVPVVYPPDTPCATEAYNETTNNGTYLSYLNLTFVPGLVDNTPPPQGPLGVNGFHHQFGSNPIKYWLVIDEGWIGDPMLEELIAHEIGHASLSHVTSGCNGNPYGNLMCGNLGLQGRIMTTSQCQQMVSALPAYVNDWN